MAERNVREAFWRNEDGSWICIDPITIEHPKGRMQVSPGTTLTQALHSWASTWRRGSRSSSASALRRRPGP
jgi:hypothetical protein